MSFLNLEDKTFLVVGVANKKSVAYHAAKTLLDEGAKVVLSIRDESMRAMVEKILPGCDAFVCDVEKDEEIKALPEKIKEKHPVLHGMVHSIAFANFSEGMKPFHEVLREDFLQAVNISMFSLVQLSNAMKELFDENASVVTISISTTRQAAQNYGYMAPIKAALDSSICFLAKSFSEFSKVRFNSVNPGLLKTSASAGIPGYIDSYIFAENVTLRKEALKTQEVANTVAFLMSPASSGINAQNLVIDAGMGVNQFDAEVIKRFNKE
ncbi:MAG: SDR family oxidoreductase [Planctomycetes bacterium]|nr:SDR family oxidoreductase [Planctomycetota bacterium]